MFIAVISSKNRLFSSQDYMNTGKYLCMHLRIPSFSSLVLFSSLMVLLNACSSSRKISSTSSPATSGKEKTLPSSTPSTNADGLIWFAKQQLGTPYKYGSADPKKGGLDCSGFLFYVFTHFNIKVPRSSYDYLSYGKPVSKQQAQKGDVIVFTGSDASQKTGGHVGIVMDNKNDDIAFIHASTSKGVVINKLSDTYYAKRFLKIVRILP